MAKENTRENSITCMISKYSTYIKLKRLGRRTTDDCVAHTYNNLYGYGSGRINSTAIT